MCFKKRTKPGLDGAAADIKLIKENIKKLNVLAVEYLELPLAREKIDKLLDSYKYVSPSSGAFGYDSKINNLLDDLKLCKKGALKSENLDEFDAILHKINVAIAGR
jgi:hypothetical protein